ncbi:hypothetical protein CJ263_15810 [Maribacter cobaltidurans]|uniref:Uncharacterized protein n=1 Tax=Maribacter cobaltidurans TaxID=1178778 RepID=A0A223V8V0_9FLAO|nr:hypothetical protein CJ263_15810 [Maribacter cobaltidurans]GGD95851.1 hypothetical protein GCM10011412_37450 [Maribacter cobaltidurans]
MGMEFGRFPTFLGNKRASGMGIGSFGVVSKILLGKFFARNVAFREMQGNMLNGIAKPTFQINSFAQNKKNPV